MDQSYDKIDVLEEKLICSSWTKNQTRSMHKSEIGANTYNHYKPSINHQYLMMIVFSTGTRFGRVRIVGPELELQLGLMLHSPAKTNNNEVRRGLA